MSNFSVNAGDGNSIFDIAYKFKQMELREMEKVPTTIRENKMSGSDTGSSDFLTKLQELHSMIFHIDKKSDVAVVDSPLRLRAVEELNKSIDKDVVNLYMQNMITNGLNKEPKLAYLKEHTTMTEGRYQISNAGKFRTYVLDELKKITDINMAYNFITAFFQFFDNPIMRDVTTSGIKVDTLQIFNEMQGEQEKIIAETMNKLDSVMSRDTFDKLSKISDTIPNLLKSILKMVNELVSQSDGKGEVWGGEYDDKNKRKLDETIKEIETEFNALENRPSVKQYIRIYKQIQEPLSILITNVKGMIDNTVEFKGAQQFSLRPLEVITPEKLDEILDQSVDGINYSNVVEIVKSVASKFYPYVDNENLIIDNALIKLKAYLKGAIITDEEWVGFSISKKGKKSKQYAGRDNLLKAIDIIKELKNDVEFRTLNPEDEQLSREKEYNEEAKGRFKDQTGQFVGAGKRRDAKQYLDPEYYHFINTMPKKRFL